MERTQKFEKKLFLINNKIRKYSVILHFFSSLRILTMQESLKTVSYFEFYLLNTNIMTNNTIFKVQFTCKFCKTVLSAVFPSFTNLYKHLGYHKAYIEWDKSYKERKGCSKSIISKEMFLLIKFICSSNIALAQLENPHFILLVSPVVEIPSYKTVRTKVLPHVYNDLVDLIGQKLESAKHVSLIADIWTLSK